MAVEFKFINFDKLYEQCLIEPFVINDHDGSSIEVKETIDSIVMKSQSGDTISLVPSCSCGELKGAYYLGEICANPKCNTPVVSPVDEELHYLAWFRQPNRVAKLIMPMVLLILLRRYRITSPSVSLVHYIMQSNLVPKGRTTHNASKLENLDYMLKTRNIKRGYNSFIENFYEIIELLEMNFGTGNKKSKQDFLDWVRLNQNTFFSSYIPLPNRGLFILDNNESVSYYDPDMVTFVHGVRRVTGIDIIDLTVANKQNKTAKMLVDFATFYERYIKDTFFRKIGLIRKHISRTRSHFTARAVVTSYHRPHKYNHIKMPWTAACTLFKLQIMKGLFRRGFSYRAAEKYFMEHLFDWSPVIREIFDELLGNGGVVCLLNRNPTLHRGSIERVIIEAIKDDPDDNTFSVSPLLCPVFNMDYDGDMLNLTPLFLRKLIEGSKEFEPHLNLLGMSGPNDFSKSLMYPKTAISTFANWYHNG